MAKRALVIIVKMSEELEVVTPVNTLRRAGVGCYVLKLVIKLIINHLSEPCIVKFYRWK